MKYIDAKRLKCELEKRLKNVRDYMNGAGMKYKGPKYHKAQGKESAYDALLTFIDNLPEEPVSDDLDEVARAYSEQVTDGHNYRDLTCGFKAGAEWQYQKDRGKFAQIKAKTWCEGFDACKEQMMENAVEGEVCGRVYDHVNVRFADGVCKYLEPKNISHIPADVKKYKVGDKVRVIIIKEEEK